MAAPNPDEMMFTGDLEQSASPTARMIIDQLTKQGVTPNAGNIRRAIEANARNITTDPSTIGSDPLTNIRNDVVENSPRPVARRAPSAVNPPMVDMGATANEGPGTDPTPGPSATDMIDPYTLYPGAASAGGLGALIAAAAPILYGLKRQFGGGGGAPVPAPTGGAPTTSAAPTPALPAPAARPAISGPPAQAALPAPTPQLALPAPAPSPQAALPAPPRALTSPTNAPPPSVIQLPNSPPPAGPVVGTSPTLRGITPSVKALQDILTKRKLGFGTGIPFQMGSPQELIQHYWPNRTGGGQR